MIYLGIDDTDMPGTPGTNQFARRLAAHLDDTFNCHLIVRHQLSQDPRVPCTSKNSAASLFLYPRIPVDIATLIARIRSFMQRNLLEGSDPGFCVTPQPAHYLTSFGRRCQTEVVMQTEARELAAQHGLHLEGIGGTQDGVIGALAAVGLAASGNDGRIVQIGQWPDDMKGPQDVVELNKRNVSVRCYDTNREIDVGRVDVGKHLRPNFRSHEVVLFARRVTGSADSNHQVSEWHAIRET